MVITYNEESNIERCLGALEFCNEIVVLDSLSTDRTVEIARRFTDKVSKREFRGYSDQKSAAVGLATQEWVLAIDADEVVTGELAAEIRSIIERPNFDAYYIPRLSYFLGRAIRHCGWYPDYQLRLVRREKAHYPEQLVHETMVVDGPTGKLKNHMLHYTNPTIDDYLRKMVFYSQAAARQRLKEGRRFRVSDVLITPGLTFLKKYIAQGGCREGIHGLILSALTGASVCIRYAILWSLPREDGSQNRSDD